MDDQLTSIRTLIQDSLDDIVSPRTASPSKTTALQRLECQLSICVQKDSEIFDFFVALQYTFECNVPLRLIPWIAEVSTKLQTLLNKGAPEVSNSVQISQLLDQLSLSLSLIQGIVMLHPASKTYLGRKYPVEILIDLLLTSRHTPCPSDPNPSGSVPKTRESQAPLSSIVMDALLCILVDSSTALRSFEECNGVQAIVKILKRAGTPREVRMKCLEFLYFYLLDESPSAETDEHHTLVPLINTAPATPIATASLRPKKPYINMTPTRPISRYGSSTYSFSSGPGSTVSTSPSGFTTSSGSTTLSTSSSTFSLGQTSRSTSASSAKSFSSTSSVASTSTAASSVQSSPTKTTADPLPMPKPLARVPSPVFKPKSLHMLQRDLDFVPESPQRSTASSVANTSLLRPQHGKSASQSSTRFRLGSAFVLDRNSKTMRVVEKVRTTEEKKAILGTMLGNVDALVEGVRKAGVWGLS
ncbi:cell division control protein 14, SIN component-domain-containing protein [Armillaria novae-zelandiae]|uniref:Cell division control protein 14, SIN component-domain-containing protein n=1 Tax=Armillaria novae-zelandiae TaxID=153914 RepID=A0AA39PXG2_9AGAR|nr:cell division control protein 14, SIN component-domain-containing protein [Armillaria novae-zelandiae]